MRSDRDRLLDILEAIDKIERHTPLEKRDPSHHSPTGQLTKMRG